MENICVVLIHSHSDPNRLETEVQQLYTPELEICYVRISECFDLLQRSTFLRKLRRVFAKIEMNVKPVSDISIYRLHLFIQWHKGLATEVAQKLNIFGKVLYRLWQGWKRQNGGIKG